MDGRGFGSGFSGWGGGSSSRGSGGYDLYGYKDTMSGGGGYGGGGFSGGGSGGQMKRDLSGASLLSSRTNADDVIAKINQRLDVLAQLEGGMSGGRRRDRFDQYESFDSRSSALGPSDLYSSGNYGYGDSRGDVMAQRGGMGFGEMGGAGGGGGFDGLSSYAPAQMRQARDAFSGSGWGARQMSPKRGGAQGGHGFGRWQDSSSMGGGGGRSGGQGPSPSGRGKLPSLLAHRMHPESGAYQPQHGSQDFPVRHVGGGQRAKRKRTRKRPLNRQPGKPQPEGQKRKQSLTDADEPESKVSKTDIVEEEEEEQTNETSVQKVELKKPWTPATATTPVAEEKNSGLSIKEEIAQLRMKLQDQQGPPSDKTENDAADQSDATEETVTPATASKPEAEGESSTLSIEEELSQLKAKLQGDQTPPTEDKPKKRRGFFEMSGVKITARRISFACSICKFRSFYSEDMAAHLESRFHKDHFRFLSNQLSKPTMDFLQEYLNIKHKKMENTVSQIMNHSAAICQVYKEQDLTRDIGMEHFMKKVEAAHCAACDMYIPMQYNLIQKHLRSPDHNYNRKYMMEESKRSGLSVARSILNHKIIRKKLESYLKNENPFTDNQEDEETGDTLATEEVPEAESPNEKPEEAELVVGGAEPAADAVENGQELEHDEPDEDEDKDELLREDDEEDGVELGEEELEEGLADL